MKTISDYIESVEKSKESLAENLTSTGLDSSSDEPLQTLVDKVRGTFVGASLLPIWRGQGDKGQESGLRLNSEGSVASGSCSTAVGSLSLAADVCSLASGHGAVAAGDSAVSFGRSMAVMSWNTQYTVVSIDTDSKTVLFDPYALSWSFTEGFKYVSVSKSKTYTVDPYYAGRGPFPADTESGCRVVKFSSDVSDLEVGDKLYLLTGYGSLGNHSASFGSYTKATSQGSFAQGSYTQARAPYSIAGGQDSSTFGDSCVALGNTSRSGRQVLKVRQAVGTTLTLDNSEDFRSFSVGSVLSFWSSWSKSYPFASKVVQLFESTCQVVVDYVPLGLTAPFYVWKGGTVPYGGTQQGQGAIAAGYHAVAEGIDSFAYGYYTESYGDASTSSGYKTKSYGQASHSQNMEAVAWGDYSSAQNYGTCALGKGSTALGDHTAAGLRCYYVKSRDTSSGILTFRTALPLDLPTEDNDTHYVCSTYDYSKSRFVKLDEYRIKLADPSKTYKYSYCWFESDNDPTQYAGYGESLYSGDSSVSLGSHTRAAGSHSLAGGYLSRAGGVASFAFGDRCVTVDSCSVSTGYEAEASGQGAHSLGYQCVANGVGAFAANVKTRAVGQYSAAFGVNTKSSSASFTAGDRTVAGYWASAAFGQDTSSLGLNSFSEGHGTSARGDYSHAAGYQTKATHSCQFALGRYNKDSYDTLFEVGKGSDASSRENAFEVKQDGRAAVSRDPQDSMDVATKNYVDLQSVGNFKTEGFSTDTFSKGDPIVFTQKGLYSFSVQEAAEGFTLTVLEGDKERYTLSSLYEDEAQILVINYGRLLQIIRSEGASTTAVSGSGAELSFKIDVIQGSVTVGSFSGTSVGATSPSVSSIVVDTADTASSSSLPVEIDS